MLDLEVYNAAGQTIRDGHHNLYQTSYTHLPPFLYSPVAALLFTVTSVIPFSTLKVCMAIANITALAVTIWIAWGLLGYRQTVDRAIATLSIIGITLWMEPVQQTLFFGQVNLLLMVVIMIDLCQSDDRAWKGIGVGFATGFKLTPAIFILYLLLTRRFRAAMVATGTLIVTILIGYVFLPIESRQYWGGLFLDSSRIGVAYAGNQSLHGTFIRLFQGIAPAQPYWLIIAAIVSVIGIGLAAWVSLNGEELLGILTCALTGLLVSPISWSHHWVWIVPFIVFMIHLTITKQAALSQLAAGLLTVGLLALFSDQLSIIWRVPNKGNREFYWQGFQHVEGELYVIIGIFLLALLTFIVLRRSK